MMSFHVLPGTDAMYMYVELQQMVKASCIYYKLFVLVMWECY